jgi:hypothetical protein
VGDIGICCPIECRGKEQHVVIAGVVLAAGNFVDIRMATTTSMVRPSTIENFRLARAQLICPAGIDKRLIVNIFTC